MDHPLRSDECKSLRKILYNLVRNGLSIPRQSNIVFVCGGNEPHHMRRRFQNEFAELLPNHQFFEPEFAMEKYRTLGDAEPFDITNFEELIGRLSHSIVVFPEAVGSFAETGYFSARPDISRYTLLAIDSAHLETDSFISIGPAKKIADVSVFQPNIQLDYRNPNFNLISQRLNDRVPLHKTQRSFEIKRFSDISSFELFCLVQTLIDLLTIATMEDVEFFLRGLFNGIIETSKTKQIVSILVGSRRLIEIGDYGHLKVSPEDKVILKVRDGFSREHDVLKLESSIIYLKADQDFRQLLVL